MIITWNIYSVNLAGFLPFGTLQLSKILCLYGARSGERFCLITVSFVSHRMCAQV
jgi:hypothetical protein